MLTGSITSRETRLRIDAQLVDVEQGTVLGTAVAEGPVGEVSSIAGLLVTKVRALLPVSDHPRRFQEAHGHSDFVSSAKAKDIGERLSREGRLFEALEEFEPVLAAARMIQWPSPNFHKGC